jgi:hypothetical protein
MLGEPPLAHRAELGGIYPTRNAQSRQQDDRDQRDDEAGEEKHVVIALNQAFSGVK